MATHKIPLEPEDFGSPFWNRALKLNVPITAAILTLFLAVFMLGARLDQIDRERMRAVPVEQLDTQAEWEARVVAAYKQGMSDGKAVALAASASMPTTSIK